MSATYRISKSQPAQYEVEKNGGNPEILSASELRQLCQTMGEPYAHLMAELENNDAVELTVAYGKVQRLSVDSSGSDRELERKAAMEVSIKPDEEQKEIAAKPAIDDAVSKDKNAASENRGSRARTNRVRTDPHAAQKLARKKRMKAAHRRRLKASHAKG